jgi:DNA recombination protein RmuC
MSTGLLAGLLVGAGVGVAVGLLLRAGAVTAARTAEARVADLVGRNRALEEERDRAREAVVDEQARSGSLREQLAVLSAQLAHHRSSADERAAALDEQREQLAGEFARLSAVALQRNNEQFLQLADTKLGESRLAAETDLANRQQAIEALLKPLGEQLARYEQGIQRIETEREGAYRLLTQQVELLSRSHEQLQKETRNLVTALRSPQTRGRWGELQLRRVVEMAGMLEHCDFDEQVTADREEGRVRPDLVVHLPGGKNVAVDAKVPLQSFLDANEAEDEDTRRSLLANHARQLRSHVDSLAKKEYWKAVEPSPEFVVAFVPGDPLLTVALEHEPGLMEHAAANHVLLATPTSLIGLLRAVAYGWQQDALAANAKAVQALGRDLYQRLSVFGEHMALVGKGLTTAVGSYNKAVGSLEARVMKTAQRFAEYGVIPGERELPALSPVDETTRQLRSHGPGTGSLELVTAPPDAGDDEPESALGR